jgi:pyroglutamyl-peptidase
MKIMVTGFGRFLDNEVNPTKEILALLPSSIKGHPITKIELPVIYDECFNVLKGFIGRDKPDVIVMLGLAGGRKAVTPERIAINLKDTLVPDNVGNKPINKEIIRGGPIAYYATLPLYKMVARIQSKGIPAAISNSAGLFVCNNIMYHVLHCLDVHKLDVSAGFIHVPYMDEMKKPKGAFSLPLHQLLEAVIDSIKVIIEEKG